MIGQFAHKGSEKLLRSTRRPGAVGRINLRQRRCWYAEEQSGDAGATAQSGATQSVNDPQKEGETPPDTWNDWLARQPEDQRRVIEALYAAQTSSLKSALDSERTSHKELEKQIRDLSGKVEKGSDAQAQLTQMADKLAVSERRADFYEAAAKPEIGIIGVQAAWVLMNADAERYFDRKGAPNFDLLKQEHPYLFRSQQTPSPRSNAGNGAGQTPTSPVDMNRMIREAAGHTSG